MSDMDHIYHVICVCLVLIHSRIRVNSILDYTDMQDCSRILTK